MSDPRSDDPAFQASPSLIGRGRYVLVGTLGSGSQAETFDAIDTATQGRVAIKRFAIRGARSWKDVELAEREARVLSTLRHPNLPCYLDNFEEDGALYLVMEKIEGHTLAQLRRAGRLDQADVTRFLEDAAETLAYLHGQAPPIIHRDIKPENVIRRPDGSYVFVDFGSVRDKLRVEGGSTVVGTFGYMAPEQFQGRALPATDLYGVGATAIACLSGEQPENLPHRGLAIDVQAALGGRCDPALVTVLRRLLEPDPDRRPRDLRTVLGSLRPAREAARGSAQPRAEHRGEQPGPRRATPEPHRPSSPWDDVEWVRKRRRNPHLVPPVLLAVLIGLVVARFATYGLFRVLLPMLLAFFAIFFGPRLRHAAVRLIDVGRAGDAGLRRAMRRVRGLPREARAQSTRYRVAPDFGAEAEDEADALEEEPVERVQRQPRSSRDDRRR